MKKLCLERSGKFWVDKLRQEIGNQFRSFDENEMLKKLISEMKNWQNMPIFVVIDMLLR